MRNKVVYVLGSGFSKVAGAPQQAEILGEVLGLNNEDSGRVSHFLVSFFGHAAPSIPLEDIFTALDRTIGRDEAIGRFGMVELWETRNALGKSIARVFAQKLHLPRADYIDRFAGKVLHYRMRDQKEDKISVISTNWDIMLDNALGEAMELYPRENDQRRRVFVDYCISDRQLNEALGISRSTVIKALGDYNVKLLKIHGSLNWLKCPHCDALYVEFGTKLADYIQYAPQECRLCRDSRDESVSLRPFLISPTFLKDLNNVHSRMAWWCSSIELSEASHIVFIGYSLPLADFEFRYLLARHIPKTNTKIKVVLFDKTDESARDARNRFADFFGPLVANAVTFEGVEQYVSNMPDDLNDLFW